MDELISRRAAIDAVVAETIYTKEELKEYYEANSHRNEWVNGIYDAVEAIKQLPPIQPEPHWISVAEDTPTEDGDYWATFDAETGRFVDWCSWYHGRWVVWLGDIPNDVSNVIAWQKSPEPYKGVTE